MSYQFAPPSTPPRIIKPMAQAPKSPIFQTPITPRRPKDSLATPTTALNSKNGTLPLNTPSSDVNGNLKARNGMSLLPITPEITPKESHRRSSRKRKINADEIFKHTDTLEKDGSSPQFGLLLPAPSTIGSGRKLTNQNKTLRVRDISFGNLSTFKVEQNYEEDGPIELKGKSLINLSAEPETPKLNIINDELVNHWHGKSFNNTYSSDEDDNTEFKIPITKKKLKNPFVSESASEEGFSKDTARKSFNPFVDNSVTDKARNELKTHIEYVNKVTGEKNLVKMSPRQASYKPRKLDFSEFNDC